MPGKHPGEPGRGAGRGFREEGHLEHHGLSISECSGGRRAGRMVQGAADRHRSTIMGQAPERHWSETNHRLLSAYCVPATVPALSAISRHPSARGVVRQALCEPGLGQRNFGSRRAFSHLSSTSTLPPGRRSTDSLLYLDVHATSGGTEII